LNTWIRPLQAEESPGLLRLLAPNRLVLEWVQERFLDAINSALGRVTGGEPPRIIIDIGSASRPAAPEAEAPVPAEPRKGAVIGSRLNPLFTFDSFVEGKSNQLA